MLPARTVQLGGRGQAQRGLGTATRTLPGGPAEPGRGGALQVPPAGGAGAPLANSGRDGRLPTGKQTSITSSASNQFNGLLPLAWCLIDRGRGRCPACVCGC